MKKTITTKLNVLVKGLAIFLLCLSATAVAHATAVTFNATVDHDWANAANWSPSAPVAGDNVTIASGKSVVISGATSTVTLDYVILNTGATLTNNGTLTIIPVTASKAGLSLNDATLDNEGTLTINSSATTYQCIDLKGSGTGTGNQLTLNGTVNLTAGLNKYAVNAGSNNIVSTLSGAGFTIGSTANTVNYGLVSANTAGSVITISQGVTLTGYSNASSGIVYFGNSGIINNYGTLSLGVGTTPSSNVYALKGYVSTGTTGAPVTASFNNKSTGVVNINGPVTYGVALSGLDTTAVSVANNIVNFNNDGVVTLNGFMGYSSGSNTGYGLYVDAKSTGTYTNTGTMTINPSLTIQTGGKNYAFKLGNGTSGGVNNTGTITVNGDAVNGGLTSNGIGSRIAKWNNNAGGKLNLNYGIPLGTRTALDTHVMLTNSGTLTGSFTIPAGGYVNNAGCTLSPGDNGATIGKIILTPVAPGTKFPLKGTLKLQVNGVTTPGVDYDQLVCSELDASAATLTMTQAYTPVLSDSINAISCSVSKTGQFSSTALPNGWTALYTNSSLFVVKYNGPSAVTQISNSNTQVYAYADAIYINFSETTAASVDVMDLSGKLLRTVKIDGSSNKIAANGLKGTFLIQVKTPQSSKTYKLIL